MKLPNLVVEIERDRDIDAVMRLALEDIRTKSATLDQAMDILIMKCEKDWSPYWVYRGGMHIALHTYLSDKRCAIIKEKS